MASLDSDQQSRVRRDGAVDLRVRLWNEMRPGLLELLKKCNYNEELLNDIETAHTQLENRLDALDELGLDVYVPIDTEEEEQSDRRADETAVVNALSVMMEQALPITIRDLSSLLNRVAPSIDLPIPRHIQEASIRRFILSSLRIALPEYETYFASIDTELEYSFFSRSNSTPKDNNNELDNMRKNYESWNKEIYTDLLKPDSKTLRLLEILPGRSDKIEVQLSRARLEDIKDDYEALSYVWGLPDPKKTIEVNGVSFDVNPSLFNALMAFRQPYTKRRIWIDAICINQADDEERSKEVSKMGKIYKLAKTVVVFLGLEYFDSGITLENAAGEIEFDLGALCHKTGVDKYAVCTGFVELCLQPWWRRIWIMQEFYLATNEPDWYWGQFHTSNAILKRAMDQLVETFENLYARNHADITPDFHSNIQTLLGDKSISQFRHDINYIRELINRRAVTDGYDIPRRLYRELSASASDPRDFVYGLREIFDPTFRELFVPDYFMSQELLFSILAVFLIQYEGWADLLWWYPYRHRNVKLPSWLPDFTKRVKPGDGEIIPRDKLVVGAARPQPRMIVVNHALHAEGYRLGSIAGKMEISAQEGMPVLRDLWKFDQSQNRDQTPLNNTKTDGECSGIDHPKGSVFDWTFKTQPDNDFQHTLVEFLPCLDAIMLLSDNSASFIHQVTALVEAGNTISKWAAHFQKQANQLEDAESTSMENWARDFLSRTAHFSGRSLFWTENGFHGLTASGVECQEDDVVLLLDGMSFPVVVRDFDENTRIGRLMGCALLRGVDLLGGNGDEPIVPAGFALGQKTTYKFT